MNASRSSTKIHNISISPLAGFAFVRMHGIYDNGSGLISIPERFKAKKHGFGELLAANPTPDDEKSISGLYADMIGSRIIFNDYSKAPVGEGVFRIPISSIIAIVTDGSLKIESVSAFQGVERCQWCGPAKDGSPNSMILDYTGFCPRCGKNALGEKKDEFSEESLKPFMRR